MRGAGAAGARWLAAAPPTALRVVVTHHPLAALHWHDEDAVLTGAAEALSRWSQAGVHLVLGGHGGAVSQRLNEGGSQSVNLLRRGQTGFRRLEQWDLQREAAP